MYRTDRESRVASRGAVILVKKLISHPSKGMSNIKNIEILTVKLNLIGNRIFNMSSVYKQPNKRLTDEDIQTIFNSYEAIITVGDLNCQNTVWGCQQSN